MSNVVCLLARRVRCRAGRGTTSSGAGVGRVARRSPPFLRPGERADLKRSGDLGACHGTEAARGIYLDLHVHFLLVETVGEGRTQPGSVRRV